MGWNLQQKLFQTIVRGIEDERAKESERERDRERERGRERERKREGERERERKREKEREREREGERHKERVGTARPVTDPASFGTEGNGFEVAPGSELFALHTFTDDDFCRRATLRRTLPVAC